MDLNNAKGVVHIAIPCVDLEETSIFYRQNFFAEEARRYHDRVTFKVFGHQIVCHLNDHRREVPKSLYPYHVGFTFTDREQYFNFYHHLKERKVRFFMELQERFPDMPEVHHTFVVLDPNNMLFEFKYYELEKFIY